MKTSASLTAAGFAKYINPVFIETGSYLGDGIGSALEAGINKIISIEIKNDHYLYVKEIHGNNDKVTIINGDSSVCLWDAIKDVDQKSTFWLDSHDFPACPILEELEQISRHPIKNHTIMIDDISFMTSVPSLAISKGILEEAVRKINPNYNIIYFDRGGQEVLIATV